MILSSNEILQAVNDFLENFRMTVNHSRSMTQSDMCCRSVANVFDLC